VGFVLQVPPQAVPVPLHAAREPTGSPIVWLQTPGVALQFWHCPRQEVLQQ
jgi:hypothetical protein